jgi:Rrf2 family protein
MKLSLKGRYALRALVVLGVAFEQGVVSIQQIAGQQNIPRRFLEQILHDLRGAGFVESRRGVAGGFRLSRPPSEITLAQIIRHLEGPLAAVPCVSEHFYEKCSCPDETNCSIRSVMAEVREATVKILEKVSVATLCDRVRQFQGEGKDPLDYVI